ncbi:hypothetical protein [Kosakonia cowanii]|uniref:hypothetical protein n=1 Tax=Kosakonia cowanii TaxID=208223 RepID=UPI0035E3E523
MDFWSAREAQYQNQPSKRVFFKACRQAHQNEKLLRVYMVDGREIEGGGCWYQCQPIKSLPREWQATGDAIQLG